MLKYQENSSWLIMSLDLMTSPIDQALILQGEICWRSLLGLKGLRLNFKCCNFTRFACCCWHFVCNTKKPQVWYLAESSCRSFVISLYWWRCFNTNTSLVRIYPNRLITHFTDYKWSLFYLWNSWANRYVNLYINRLYKGLLLARIAGVLHACLHVSFT